eukprot:TRINITY_DN62891_c0_g1_i1.p1 TRINITY_DN62891_c0_g1~~TRINITY_DN62891_c0_g1_i1.p1  ORF type:complete len:354 (-),score=109.92 TRINITY_DN62891_c0_g1_i1:27-1049(-)
MARGTMPYTLSALLLLVCRCEAFCPQGFGQGAFPAEYKIPAWPTDMSLEDSAKLVTIKLGGFKMDKINEEYLQGPNEEFKMQGRQTYWQASGQYFMYYCQRFRKWRIAEISAFSKNMDGQCFAFVSDAHPERDIENTSLIKGFIEVDGGEWKLKEEAGVTSIGTLGDQMGLGGDAEEEEEEVEAGSCEASSGGEQSSIAGEGEEEDKSNCPVMPKVRKVKKKIIEVTKAAGKWARRLFPNYLGAPDEEDAIPDVVDAEFNPLFGGEEIPKGNCEPSTLKGCSFKEQFYIEKQLNSTAEKRKSELGRLVKLKEVVMKEDQKNWLMSRISILVKMTTQLVQE